MGEFVIEVRADRAPLTAANFLRYVREGFYSNTLFHRVVANFVIQGGGHDATTLQSRSPRTTASSTSPATACRTSAALSDWRAATSPHSGNAQFYVNLVDNPDLDPVPTRWGYSRVRPRRAGDGRDRSHRRDGHRSDAVRSSPMRP